MFKSVLRTEMISFLEIRKVTTTSGQSVSDASALLLLDNHLENHCYREKVLSEDILNTWIQTLCGKSKTVNSKIVMVRNFVKYLNTMGNQSFLPDAVKVKSDYIP